MANFLLLIKDSNSNAIDIKDIFPNISIEKEFNDYKKALITAIKLSKCLYKLNSKFQIIIVDVKSKKEVH